MNQHDIFQNYCFEWSKIVFPSATLESRLAHMVSEVDEIIKEPYDLSEWADAYLLFFQAAKSAGHSVSEIFTAAVVKQNINESRKWGKPNAQGFSEHLKEDVHTVHCNQGEYVGYCKYGEFETCTALRDEDDKG